MAGNSSRRGAVRKSRKGPSKGTGGNNKKRLSGKGPTPKAEDRPYHAAAKRKAARNKPAAGKPRSGEKRSNFSFHGEMVTGRNAVLEALRADVPATEFSRSISTTEP